MKSLDVAIVGAGIAGLTAAIAMANKGHTVQLFEAAPVLGDVGAGITLAPNAMCGMDYIGVGDEIVKTGIEPSTQIISHWQSGKDLMTVEREGTVEKYGSAYVYIHRADLHKILTDAAAQSKVKIHLGKQVSSVNSSESEAQINFEDGSTHTADLIIGADGLKSQVRKLFSPTIPHFTGHIAFRALAPVTPQIQHLLDQPGMHIGPGKMVVRYPLRKGSILNLVFFARQDGWTDDGWSIPAELSEIENLYSDWCTDVKILVSQIKPGTVFKWAVNAHKPLEGWNLNDNVTLIGDAAHAMTPFLGQGAATAIEDAVMLSRSIDESSSLAEALSRYQQARHGRTSFIQQESNENADRLQGSETELYGLGNLRNEETLGLFSYDCVTEAI